MLHICQKELEDTIEYLEASSMELEIKSLDETGTRKKLLGKALQKKKKDLKMKQNELAETMKLIDRHTTEGTLSVAQNSMRELHRRVTMIWMVIIEMKYSNQKE